MSAAVAGPFVVALCLALLGVISLRRGQILGEEGGQGQTLLGIFLAFLAVVFLLIALLKAGRP